MSIGQAFEDVFEHETELAAQLRAIAERHAGDQDVYHVGHAQARAAGQRIERLAPHAERHGAKVPAPPAAKSPAPIEGLRRKSAEMLMLSRVEPAGRLLLHDLRKTYLHAQGNELAWVILMQTARVVRDAELLDTATECHERAVACASWLRTRIKETAPLVLSD